MIPHSPSVYLIVIMLLACAIIAVGPPLARYLFFSI